MGRPPGIKYGGTIPARFEIPTMKGSTPGLRNTTFLAPKPSELELRVKK
jgi:hypothetical protein